MSARAEHGVSEDLLDVLAARLAERSGPTPLLDAEQAGRLLAVPSTWLLAEARADRVPHVRLGRYVRFDADELDAWWRARARGPWRTRGAAARAAAKTVTGIRTGDRPVARGANTA